MPPHRDTMILYIPSKDELRAPESTNDLSLGVAPFCRHCQTKDAKNNIEPEESLNGESCMLAIVGSSIASLISEEIHEKFYSRHINRWLSLQSDLRCGGYARKSCCAGGSLSRGRTAKRIDGQHGPKSIPEHAGKQPRPICRCGHKKSEYGGHHESHERCAHQDFHCGRVKRLRGFLWEPEREICDEQAWPLHGRSHADDPARSDESDAKFNGYDGKEGRKHRKEGRIVKWRQRITRPRQAPVFQAEVCRTSHTAQAIYR